MLSQITEITEDEDKAKEICDAAKSSMGTMAVIKGYSDSNYSIGTDISEIDLKSIMDFTDKVVHLTEYKQKLQAYLLKKMFVRILAVS